MGNEFKDFEMETPSLTLEPDLGELEKKEEVLPKKLLWCPGAGRPSGNGSGPAEDGTDSTDTGRTENGK